MRGSKIALETSLRGQVWSEEESIKFTERQEKWAHEIIYY
jgi:hypothetical protein